MASNPNTFALSEIVALADAVSVAAGRLVTPDAPPEGALTEVAKAMLALIGAVNASGHTMLRNQAATIISAVDDLVGSARSADGRVHGHIVGSYKTAALETGAVPTDSPRLASVRAFAWFVVMAIDGLKRLAAAPEITAGFERATKIPPNPSSMASAATPATPATPADAPFATPTDAAATQEAPAQVAATQAAAESADPVGDALARDLADEAWYSLVSAASEAARKSYGAVVPAAAHARSGAACPIGGGSYRIVGSAPAAVRDEAAALAALRKAAPYLDALLARGYAVAGGAVLSAVIGGDVADVDAWRAGADPAEVEAVLVWQGLKFRRFEGARHFTWAFAPAGGARFPQLQLIRADFGAAECFRYFDIAIAKMAAVAIGGAPRVVLAADAARALATGVCPLDLARASPAFGRRLAKYSRRFRFAIRRRDGMRDNRFRITAAQTLVVGYHYGTTDKVLDVKHVGRLGAGAADEADKVSGYGAAVAYSFSPAGDTDTEEINLRSLKRGDPQFLTRYDGWDSFALTARHIARKAAEASFAMARALLDDAAYRAVVAAACSATADMSDDAQAELARAVSDVLRAFAARRLAEMPPVPPIAELFARAPIDADAFYIPLGQ